MRPHVSALIVCVCVYVWSWQYIASFLVTHLNVVCSLYRWSDPEDIEGWGVSPRGAGFTFGADSVQEFNRTNNLQKIARAHQLAMQGYQQMFNDTLVTVWSAPNYCYRCGNVAAILKLDANLNEEYIIFKDAPASERAKPTKRPPPDYFL